MDYRRPLLATDFFQKLTPPTTVWPKLKGQFYERPPAGSVEAAERVKKEAEELEKPRRRWGSKLRKKMMNHEIKSSSHHEEMAMMAIVILWRQEC